MIYRKKPPVQVPGQLELFLAADFRRLLNTNRYFESWGQYMSLIKRERKIMDAIRYHETLESD